MKPEHELALEEVREDQARLHRSMQRLDERIHSLVASMKRVPPPSQGHPIPRKPEPAVAPPAPAELRHQFAPIVFKAPQPVADHPRPVEAREPSPETPPATPVEKERHPASAEEPTEMRPEGADSIEMTIGRVWLVRLGIVILLTGLVFLGNLAYQHIIPRLGPGAKLAMIYFAGLALGGVGLFLERTRESLRNYARVVLAGGCATIYYATYAAHFVAPLRVIESPVLAGSLLLGLAVGIAVAADRRRSETLALIALVLSYYTSGLNPIGHFTLFSSFLLAGTAIFFLVRHRWARLTAASLAGTYMSYVWCRFTGHGGALSGGAFESLAFLGGYWALFTAGGFLAKREALGTAGRVQFLTANNAAFAVLGGLEIMRYQPANAWGFSLAFGVILIALSRLARWRAPEHGALESAFLVQGFALTTLGLALKLTGQQLALVLAAQSVLLLAGKGPIPWLRMLGSALNMLGATGLAAVQLLNRAPHSEGVAAVVGAALIANAWIYRRRVETSLDRSSDPALAMTVIALCLGTGALYQAAGWPQVIAFLAGGAAITAVLPRKAGLRELTLAGQFLLPVATFLWAIPYLQGEMTSRLESRVLIAIGVILSLWWARQKRVALDDVTRHLLEGMAAFCAAIVAVAWTQQVYRGVDGLWAPAIFGTAWLAIAVASRAGYLALGALGFTLAACEKFFGSQSLAHWALALLPIAHLLIVAALSRRFSRRFGAAVAQYEPTVTGSAVFAASVMAIAWTFAHIDREWQALFFALAGAATSVAGALTRQKNVNYVGLGLGIFAWGLAVIVYRAEPTWQHLAAITFLPAAARFSRKHLADDVAPGLPAALTWASMTGITIWAMRWCHVHVPEMSPTIAWTFLALGFFAAGLLLRDRHYRLGGLGLLVVSIGRVFFVDVWAFNEVARILSFIVLGTVLLVVGYFYNRFEAQLRRLL